MTKTITPEFPTLAVVERQHIAAAVQQAEGNLSKASRMLGIDRRTLYRRIASEGIEVPTRPISMGYYARLKRERDALLAEVERLKGADGR
jgi:transposase-like protein